MQPKFLSSVVLAVTFGALASTASAQVVVGSGNVNQISGSASFSAGSVLPLNVGGFYVSTQSIGLNPARYASTNGAISGPGSADYEVTVLSDDLTHNVSVRAASSDGRDYYYFQPKVSPAVPLEPAPGVSLDFAECSGAVQVNFLKSGSPASVDTFASQSRSELTAGSGNWASSHQATTSSAGATSSEIYPVRGDDLEHLIAVQFRLGGVQYQQSFQRTVACGETVVIEIELDDIPVIDPGSIKGELDLRFEDELANSRMYADSGPYGNSGNTTIVPGYGAFEILNLYPSTAVSPVDPYDLYGVMSFDTLWGRETFTTPRFSVEVPSGAAADVGTTFVMDEGFIGGQVEMVGPEECVNRINSGLVRAFAQGQSGSSRSGSAYQDLTGSVSGAGAGSQYNAAYRLAVGTPNNVAGQWRPQWYVSNRDAADSSLSANYWVYNDAVGAPVVAPGDNIDAPIAQCVIPVKAGVSINGTLATGTTFNNPRMSFTGGLVEDGFNYRVSGSANGSPNSSSARGTSGYIPACLPAGTYDFDTTVSAEGEGGLISDTVLRHQTAPLPCGAEVKPFFFKIELSDVQCAGGDTAELPFEMDAEALGGGGRALHTYAWVNGGPDAGGELIEICGGSSGAACPDAAEFSSGFVVDTTDLLQCGNTVEVFIESSSHDISRSGERVFAFEQYGPSGPGCDDVQLNLAGAATAELDLFAVSSQLNECGLGQTADTVCVVYDSANAQTLVMPVVEGTTMSLGAGAYQGQCYVTTGCGFRTCSFDTTVTQ